MSDPQIQVGVSVSSEGAERALDNLADKAGQMATSMQRDGEKAGAAVDVIGAKAVKSADQFSTAEGRIAASIKRATTNLENLGKTASQKLEFQIASKGLDSAKFEPMLAKLRELEAANVRLGMSAGQTAAALRNVPAQMTDVFVSLASGQQPMTVLLQQGGQLKDMFGGVGAAARAVGGYIASMINPLTITAAAVGGLGYAFYSGRTEADEFRKNLILTGNAAGLTVDKFNTMAASLGNLSGITQGAASEALTQMAASGNISATSIEKLTQAAIQFEKAGGPAVADTVKQFEELGKNPVEASVKLSEKTHYLTLAVYEQIKALEDQGKTSEAAAVAQKAWADAIDQRTPQMVQNIGLLESAWREMAGTAAMAWDTLKGIGRDDSTVEDKLGKLQTRLAQAKSDLANPSRARFAESVTLIEKEIADLEQRTDKAVAKRAADAERDKQRIAAASGVDKLIESQRSKREQYSAELKKLNDQRSSDLISEEKYLQAKAALAKKYEEKPASAPKRTEAEKELARMAKLDAEESSRRIANAQRVGAEMNKETEAIWAKVEAENAAREAIGLSKSGIESRTLAIMQEQLAWRDALGLEDEQTEQLKRNIAAQRALVDASQNSEIKQAGIDAAKAAADAHKKAAEDAAREWQKTVDTIDGTFHDAFTDMLKQGEADWESFTDSLATTFKSAVADEIYKMTLKPLVLNVVGSFSGAGAPAVPGADGQSLSISNGFGVISGVQAAWAGMSGGITNAANSFALSGMGQAAGLSTSGAVMGPPTAAGAMGWTDGALTGAGGTFAAAAAPVLGALTAAYAIAEMQKSGWGIDNDAKSGALAAVSVGTLGANVILDRLFGHNRTVSNDAQGISGTFDLSGFEGQNYQERSQKGGTFRSDRRWTDYSAIDADMDQALDSMLKQAVAGVQTIGKTLSVETGNVMEGFSHTFALQLSENGDMSKAGEKIAAELKKVQDELVTRLVPNIADFARYGESAADTFDRLNQEVTATDAILLAMGKDASEAFGAVGLASIKAREDLIDLAGGLDKLAGKTQAYYANFYTSDEQAKRAAEQAQKVLNKGFSDLSLTLPTDRKGFRDLVESYGKDLSTEGARKLFNALLDLQDEFDAVADVAEADAKKIKDATTAAQQGQASLFDTFASDAQKLEAAKKLVSDTFSSIGEAVPATAADFLKLAQTFDPATEGGKSFIDTLSKVSGAFAFIQKSVADSSAAMVASAQAAAQAIAQASSSRRSVMDQFDTAGSVARAQADINAAFGRYGATAPTDRAGVAAVAGSIDINTALGQEQMAALQSLSGAFEVVFGAQEKAAQAAESASQSAISAARDAANEQMRLANQVHDSISGALKSLLGQSEQYEQQTRQMAQATLQSALVIAKAGGSLSNFAGLDAALESVTKLDKATFATAAGYAVEFGRTANLLTQLEQYTRINGSHASGLDYVPFDGYVAQLHKGERVQTAASASAADATAAEVKALRADLNAIGAALASYTQKTAKLMEKFDVIGISARA